jgi:hypothetical protein
LFVGGGFVDRGNITPLSTIRSIAHGDRARSQRMAKMRRTKARKA